MSWWIIIMSPESPPNRISSLLFAQNPSDTSLLSSVPSTSYFQYNTGHFDIDQAQYAEHDHWVPDWGTLKPAKRPNQGTVLCWVKEKKEVEGDRFARDPKTILEIKVDRAKNEFGVEFKIGFEIEFHLLDSVDATENIRGGG